MASALSSIQSTDPTVRSAVASALARLSAAEGAAAQTKTATQNAAGQASVAKYLAGAINYQAPGLLAAINMLHDGAGQLASGIEQLRNGNSQLAGGIAQLANGGGQLRGGLGQLTSGAGQLEAGLALLASGTGQLATGLQPAPAGAGAIANGLGIMEKAVTKARGQIPSTKDLETLFKQSPGMFRSGYFVLAAVDGARGADRNAATFTINLDHGATAGQIVVTSRYWSGDPRSVALHERLIAMGQTFGRAHNATVAIGGPGGNLTDLTAATQSKIWIDVAVIAIALTLVLALALRAIVLPIVAVALNLLSVAAAFGVIQLLFGASNPPLGGPGFLDPVSTISIFTVAFGIGITYSTVLLMRTREAYVAGGNPRQVVAQGLQITAAAATGGALVMVGALAPFAASELINIRELGVGGWHGDSAARAARPAGPAARRDGCTRAARVVANARGLATRGPDKGTSPAARPSAAHRCATASARYSTSLGASPDEPPNHITNHRPPHDGTGRGEPLSRGPGRWGRWCSTRPSATPVRRSSSTTADTGFRSRIPTSGRSSPRSPAD